MGNPLLITDLDNTLWNWFSAWHGSFSALLRELVGVTGLHQDTLESEMREVHQTYGTTEYSNLLNELPSLIAWTGGPEPWTKFPGPLKTFRSERERLTRLYPDVAETLDRLKHAGFQIIAYTESVAYWTEWRIRKTGLDGVIDVLYSAPDHDLPRGMSTRDLRSRPESYYGLDRTQHRHVPRGVLKPNARVLEQIVSENGASRNSTFYIGDSLMKDVAMAQEAGITDIYAKYGAVAEVDYDLLRRVSHWSDEDIARERRINQEAGHVFPTHTCDAGFKQILEIIGLADSVGP